MKLYSLLQEFISLARESEQITIYNKAALQHELATFLQQHLPEESYGVQISREAEQVVMRAKGANVAKEVIDLYVYQITGKEQYGVQVTVYDEQGRGETASGLRAHLQFLESLKKHGFKEAHLLLACKAPIDEAQVKLPPPYQVVWQEL